MDSLSIGDALGDRVVLRDELLFEHRAARSRCAAA
jgi:hypothetical protein